MRNLRLSKYLLPLGFVVSTLAYATCDVEFIQFCKTNLKQLTLTKDVKLFHWFKKSYSDGGKGYIAHSLSSFMPSQPSTGAGQAGTAGLYLATDPHVTCSYGGSIGEKNWPMLAVLTVPKGTRVISFNGKNFESPGCVFHSHYWTTPYLQKACVQGIPSALFAYPYMENTPSGVERDLFGGFSVSFTAGEKILSRDKATVEIFSYHDLLFPKSLETAAIAKALFRFPFQCLDGKKPQINKDLSEKDLEDWQKRFLMALSNSKDFFVELSPHEIKHEQAQLPPISTPEMEKH